MNCHYCNQPAEWVENKEIYGRNYGRSYMAWLCRPCDAYVGCHNNTKKALGSLANKALRELRKESKKKWIEEKLGAWETVNWRKDKAYKELSEALHIPKSQCHFGMFDEEMCRKVLSILKD